MGGSTTTNSAQQTQATTQLPPWINEAAQQNYAFAQNVAAQPLQQYQGQMVAGVSPQTQQAWNTAATGANAGADQYNAAQAGFLGVLGQQPQNVTAGQLSSTNLSPYMNPYTQSVINATLPIMQQQLGQQQIGNQSQAAGAGAYGGSRQAIQQGVTQAQGAQNMTQMAQQLNQANFGQAQAAAAQDIANRLTADTSNQAAQTNYGQLANVASQGLAGLGTAAQANQVKNFTEQMTAGAAEQQQAQNEINANMAKFQQAWQYPATQLGVLQSALGMTPYGNSQTGYSTGTQTTSTSPNFASLITSGLQGLGSLFPGAGNSLLSGLFTGSDRKLKTDISKVGMHPAGVPMYAYRYKGDPKRYPKVVGPMAEDVAKIAPHAVAPIPGSRGRMAVHMPTLNALSAARMGAGPPGSPPPGFGAPPPGAGPPGLPGPLAAPAPMGLVGALGGTMRPPQAPRIRRPRPPQIMGALGVG